MGTFMARISDLPRIFGTLSEDGKVLYVTNLLRPYKSLIDYELIENGVYKISAKQFIELEEVSKYRVRLLIDTPFAKSGDILSAYSWGTHTLYFFDIDIMPLVAEELECNLEVICKIEEDNYEDF